MNSPVYDFAISDLGERKIASPLNIGYFTSDSKRLLLDCYLSSYDHRKNERCYEGDPEGAVIVNKDVIGDKGGKHRHFTLAEVDHFRCLVNDNDGNSKQAIAGADGQSLDDQLSYRHFTPL